MSTALTAQISDELAKRIRQAAAAKGQSESAFVSEALIAHFDRREWVDALTREGVEAIRRGETHEDSAVVSEFNGWGQ